MIFCETKSWERVLCQGTLKKDKFHQKSRVFDVFLHTYITFNSKHVIFFFKKVKIQKSLCLPRRHPRGLGGGRRSKLEKKYKLFRVQIDGKPIPEAWGGVKVGNKYKLFRVQIDGKPLCMNKQVRNRSKMRFWWSKSRFSDFDDFCSNLFHNYGLEEVVDEVPRADILQKSQEYHKEQSFRLKSKYLGRFRPNFN